jgi:hypothetical protein
MGERYWLWVGVRLLVAVLIVAWAGSYLATGSGEKEFQKTLDAMKQVHTFRAAESATPEATLHTETLWEADCSRLMVRYQTHWVDSGAAAPRNIDHDVTYVGLREYERKSDGSWSESRYSYRGGSATGYCNNIAQGTDSNLLPDIATMIKRGIIQKGDKKTVNGVRCREWLVTMRGAPSGLEHDTVCIGLEDHLPYEMTVDWAHSRASFSDYNTAIQLDLPEASLQPASATN